MVKHWIVLAVWALSSGVEPSKCNAGRVGPFVTQRCHGSAIAFCSTNGISGETHSTKTGGIENRSCRRRNSSQKRVGGVLILPGSHFAASCNARESSGVALEGSAGGGDRNSLSTKHWRQFRPKTLKDFNKKLHMHAKRGEAKDAETLLEKMHTLHSSGKLADPPDIISYGSVMDALARCKDDDAAERAESLSTRLITYAELGGTTQPNLHFFNALLNCYAERGNAEGAEQLLDEMHQLQSVGNLVGGPPDAVSYATTIKALGNSNMKNRIAVEHAEHILHEFEDEDNARLNCQTYVALLRLYAKWGLGDEAEKLLQRMHDMDDLGYLEDGPPNIIAYTAALNAWVRSKDRKAASRAEALFRRMEEGGENSGSIRPDVIAYNTLLRCYAERGMAHEAELLLMRMERLYASGKLRSSAGGKGRGKNRGFRGNGPDRISYTTVLTALAKSDDAYAPDRAVALLDQMRQLHAEGRGNMMPDVVTHACVIRCALKGQDHRQVSPFEQAVLLKKLQIEEWPFRDQSPLPWD